MEISVPEKFKGKYRIESARLKYWDYSADGGYFITIVTKDRECFFGEIVDGEMKLSEMGLIAEKYWTGMTKIYDNLIIDEFVIMPNHTHMVLFIENKNPTPVETRRGASLPPPFAQNVWMTNKFGPLIKKSVSSIINHYKGQVTKYAKHHQITFTWQPRYHDRVIRSESELNRIREYISNNPAQWKTDRNNDLK
jgi:REP element-mobilizing transposase RayT